MANGTRYHVQAEKEFIAAQRMLSDSEISVEEYQTLVDEIRADLDEGAAKYGVHTPAGAALARRSESVRKQAADAVTLARNTEVA